MSATDTDTDYTHSTADVAARLRCHSRTVLRRARAIGVGIDLEGRAGMRFSEADIAKLVNSLRPAAPTAPRRKRRRTAVRA